MHFTRKFHFNIFLNWNFALLFITEETSDVFSSIEVSSLPIDITDDFITDFFENSRRSGGGEVEDVSYDEKTNTAIITFKDPAGYF